MSPWRSPLYFCDCKPMEVFQAATPEDNNAGSEGLVVVPVSGWYALCFGYVTTTTAATRLTNCHHHHQTQHRSETGKDGNGSPVRYYNLNIQPSDGSPSVVRPLPWPQCGHTHGPVLCDIHIGQLVYLTQGCALAVTSSAEANSGIEHVEESDERWKVAETCPKWGVIYYRMNNLVRHPKDDDATNILAPLLPLAVGTLRATSEKSFVCSDCVRSFPSLRSVQSHRNHVHVPRQQQQQQQQPHHHDHSLFPVPRLAPLLSLYERPLEVVYQDEYMAIVVKPQGMPVQGAKPSLLRSDLLLSLRATNGGGSHDHNNDATPKKKEDAALGKPRPVHRLDSATGGLLVVAKTRRAEANLRRSFASRDCLKRYRALVTGQLHIPPPLLPPPLPPPSCQAPAAIETTTTNIVMTATTTTTTTTTTTNTVIQGGGCDPPTPQPPEMMTIDSPISGKASLTKVVVVRHVPVVRSDHQRLLVGVEADGYTVVDLWPVTGRKHQLRRHLQRIGHSILGDTRYGGGGNGNGTSSSRSAHQQQQRSNPGGSGLPSHTDGDSTDMAGVVAAAVPTGEPSSPTSSSSLAAANDDSHSRLCLWALEITLPHPITRETMTFRMKDPDWLHYVIQQKEGAQKSSPTNSFHTFDSNDADWCNGLPPT